MKKRIVLTLAFAFLFVGALVTLAIARVNDLVKLLRPQIEAQIEKAIGAPVTIGGLDIRLFPSTELVVQDLRIHGDSSPSIEKLKAKLSLLPLFSRQLDASEIRLERPSFSLARDSQGFTVRGIPRREPNTTQRGSPPNSPSKEPNGEEGAQHRSPASLTLHLERIIVTDGSLTVQDLRDSTSTKVSGIDLDAGVKMQGGVITIPRGELKAVLPGENRVSLSAHSSTFNQETYELNIPKIELKTAAGTIKAEATLNTNQQKGLIKASAESLGIKEILHGASLLVPSLAAVGIDGAATLSQAEIRLSGPGAVSFKAPLELRDVSTTLPGGLNVKGLRGPIAVEGSTSAVRFASQKLELSLNRAPLTLALDGQFRVNSPNTLSFERLDVQGFEGSARVPLTLSLGTPQQVRANASLEGVSIQSVLAAFNPERAGNFTGTVASLKANVSGALGPGVPSLRGPGSLSIVKGTLKGFNLPRAVLSAIGKGLPFVDEALADSVPPEFAGIMNEPDTRIESLDSTFELQGELTMLLSLRAVSDIFTLESSGSIARDGNLDLKATLTFTEQFSRALARRVKDIGKVYDSKGCLVIPLTLQGRTPKLLVLPDLSKLMQTGAGKIVEREAGRAIDRALGKDPETAKQLKDLLGGFMKR